MTSTLLRPRSVGKCGHLGDGPGSEHTDERFTAGHGECKVSNCGCLQFTWAGFTTDFISRMNKQQESDRGKEE